MDTKDTSNQKEEISKIKLPNGNVIDIKDAELRHQINVLIGIEKPDNK